MFKCKTVHIMLYIIILAGVVGISRCYEIALADTIPELDNTKNIVATVAGNSIVEGDILPTQKIIDGRYYGAKILDNNTTKEAIQNELEAEKLTEKIRLLLMQELLKRYSIEVNDKEINDQVEILIGKFHPFQSLEVSKQKLKVFLNAINMIFNDHADPQAIYNEYLKQDVTPSLWNFEKTYYQSPFQREQLAKQYDDLLKVTKSDIENGVKLQAKDEITGNKLRATILNEIAKSDPEAKNDLKELRSDKQSANSDADQKLRGKYVAWWKDTFKKEIIIKDHTYDEILNSLEPLVPYSTP